MRDYSREIREYDFTVTHMCNYDCRIISLFGNVFGVEIRGEAVKAIIDCLIQEQELSEHLFGLKEQIDSLYLQTIHYYRLTEDEKADSIFCSPQWKKQLVLTAFSASNQNFGELEIPESSEVFDKVTAIVQYICRIYEKKHTAKLPVIQLKDRDGRICIIDFNQVRYLRISELNKDYDYSFTEFFPMPDGNVLKSFCHAFLEEKICSHSELEEEIAAILNQKAEITRIMGFTRSGKEFGIGI